jgi:hypothetical protein
LKEKAIAVVVSQQIFVIFKKTNCENFWNFFGFSSVKMTKFSIFWKKIEKKKKKKKKPLTVLVLGLGHAVQFTLENWSVPCSCEWIERERD